MGSPLRQEYAIVGDIVNMAARLMTASKMGILIDKVIIIYENSMKFPIGDWFGQFFIFYLLIFYYFFIIQSVFLLNY